ncbi:MAG: SusC/RagA family TonB-linked outer membrane protein [Tannerellaceae bacterium]|jgi:TonB-linked SusC/RagA family outer membrane protein|nr:SusC/RagA family TonB-linked outer membrane protein [Tannerellaceae bacterium]
MKKNQQKRMAIKKYIYRIIHDLKTIVLLLVLGLGTAYATNSDQQQSRNISGKVTDANGESIPGVSVLLQGTATGTITDIDGNYTIYVPDNNSVLVFSYISYIPQEVVVGDRTVIPITLRENVEQLEEVVVTALGIKREKKALGYSVSEVKGDNLTQTSQGSVLNALAGKISGVKINQMDGTSGSSVNMIIRGATSLNNDNQPLFIIDGVPVKNQLNNIFQGADFGNPISDLNPDDIENVSVLKGASAAALYGSRAGNGVVLITTRSGQGAKKGIGISVSSSNVAEIPYHYFPLQSTFGSGKSGAHLLEEEENESWGMQLDTGETAVVWNSNGQEVPLVSYPNRFKDFIRTGFTTTNNVSIDGNYDKGFFRLSAGSMQNEGIIPNVDLSRTTISLNTGYNLTKKLKITALFNWASSGSDNRPNVNGEDRNDIVRSLTEIGAQVNIMDLRNYWIKGQEGINQLRYKTKQNNPWFVAYENTNAFDRERLTTKIQFDYDITDELRIMGRFTRDGNVENRESKRAFSSYSEPNGAYIINDINRKETNFELNLSYKNTFFEKWSLNAFVAGNRMYSYTKEIYNHASRLVVPALYTISNGVPGAVTYKSGWYEKGIYSVYGMASIGYSDMVYLDLTARNDWSSTLPVENRSYFYPSASVSILFSEVFKLPQWISFAKLRGGIAQVGNDTEPYSLYPYFSTDSDWGSSKRMYMDGGLLNSNLVPEKSTSQEAGLELRFLDNRVSVEATYYVVKNKNQILDITVPVESGATSKKINAGEIESKGWEISLNTTPVISGKFQWDMGFNFTGNKTRLKELAEGMTYVEWMSTDGASIRTYEGGLIGDIFCQPMLTVADKDSPYYGYPLLNSSGQYQTDNNPDHIIKIGNANPDFNLSFLPNFRYANFSLYANIDWNHGGKFYSKTRMFMQNNGMREDTFSGISYDPTRSIEEQIKANPQRFFGEWVGGRTAEYGGFPWPAGTGEGRRQDASFNVGVREVVVNGQKTYVENLGGSTTRWLDPFTANRYANRPFPYRNTYDATYIKLREVALSYHLPNSFLKKLYIQNAVISVIATNMFTWTKAKADIEPERAYRPSDDGKWSNGFEYYNTLPWTGTLGLKVSFDI